jgi:hypothetical protein
MASCATIALKPWRKMVSCVGSINGFLLFNFRLRQVAQDGILRHDCFETVAQDGILRRLHQRLFAFQLSSSPGGARYHLAPRLLWAILITNRVIAETCRTFSRLAQSSLSLRGWPARCLDL